MSDGNSATLVVRRPRQWGDRLRAYAIEVGGENVGEIRAGEEKTVSIEAGTRSLRCRIDWCGSNTEALTVAPGEVVAYEVRTSIAGWRLLFAIIYIVFLRNRYLQLARVEEERLPEARVH